MLFRADVRLSLESLSKMHFSIGVDQARAWSGLIGLGRAWLGLVGHYQACLDLKGLTQAGRLINFRPGCNVLPTVEKVTIMRTHGSQWLLLNSIYF